MNHLYYLKQYLITLVIFLGIDAIWLGFVAKGFYSKYIGHVMAENPNFIAAGIFYLINIIGILIFCVNPALQKHSLITAVILGALYGLFTYATYDLTNLATIKDWPLIVTIVDIIWGIVLTSTVAAISFILISKIR